MSKPKLTKEELKEIANEIHILQIKREEKALEIKKMKEAEETLKREDMEIQDMIEYLKSYDKCLNMIVSEGYDSYGTDLDLLQRKNPKVFEIYEKFKMKLVKFYNTELLNQLNSLDL